MLTRFWWLSRTNKHTNTCQNTRIHLCLQNHFLCFHHTRVVGGGIMFLICPFVRSFVRPSVHASVRSSVTKLLTTIFWNRINRFWYQSVQVVHEAKVWNNDGGQEVKGQGYTRPKVDLEVGGSTILNNFYDTRMSHIPSWWLSVFWALYEMFLNSSFIHSFIAICRAHYVENIESEALIVSLRTTRICLRLSTDEWRLHAN